LAQVIKNRRGPIGNLNSATANNGEIIVASGSISDLSGPFVFVGSPTPSDNGSSGAFKSVSKIYTGTNAPTITAGTYGTTLDGTPFYSTGDESLYILNNNGVGNTQLDLTGNIEGNTISSVTIDTLNGDVSVVGDVTASNLQLSGDADITGNIVLGGNITLGDQDIDFVQFKADVSSSILPDIDNTFDLGSPSKQWANIYVDTANIATSSLSGDLSISGSAEIAGGVQLLSTLDVDAQSTLSSVTVEDLTDGRVVLAGTGGELEDSANLTFDGSTLTTTGNISGTGTLDIDGQSTLASAAVEDLTSGRVVLAGAGGELEDSGNLTFDGTTLTTDGNISGSGTLNIDGNTTLDGTLNVGGNSVFDGDVFLSGSLTMLGSATELIVSSSTVELDDNIIRLNAYSPFERYAGFEVIDSGSVGVSASLQWDSLNDYWLIQSSSQESGKIISTTFGTFGSEASLTDNTIPKATAENSIGDSLLIDDGSALTYDTDAISVASTTGNTSIKGIVSLTNAGGTDGETNSSAVLFRNASNQLGYVSTTETTNVLDGILGYRSSTGALEFSTVIDGGTF